MKTVWLLFVEEPVEMDAHTDPYSVLGVYASEESAVEDAPNNGLKWHTKEYAVLS